jgi:hypothetical protein
VKRSALILGHLGIPANDDVDVITELSRYLPSVTCRGDGHDLPSGFGVPVGFAGPVRMQPSVSRHEGQWLQREPGEGASLPSNAQIRAQARLVDRHAPSSQRGVRGSSPFSSTDVPRANGPLPVRDEGLCDVRCRRSANLAFDSDCTCPVHVCT